MHPPRRILIGGMSLESNSFSPFGATLSDFRQGIYFVEGQAMLDCFEPGTGEIRGFLDGLGSGDYQIIPTVASQAVSSGAMDRASYDWFLNRWLSAIEEQHPAALLLALHGATLAENSQDACGELLVALRRAAGPGVFIGVTLDMHANVTRRMFEAADVLYGFHTYPHVDQYATGLRVGWLARVWLEERLQLSSALCRAPMLVAPGNQSTAVGPNAELVAATRALEAESGVLAASFFQPQPWLDVREIGATALVITWGDKAGAEQRARRLARQMWERRHAFELQLPGPVEAVAEALSESPGPVVLSDLGDGAGGGAAGDSTVLLREFLRVAPETSGPLMLTLTDPQAVAAAEAAGLGATLSMPVGGRFWPVDFQPVEVTGQVAYLGKPSYKPYHMLTSMGRTCLLAISGIQLLITEKPIFVYSPEVYQAVGLDPFRARIVVVKSGAQFRQFWEGRARRIILVNTPGPTCNELRSLPFRHLPHPLFPWEDWDWQL